MKLVSVALLSALLVQGQYRASVAAVAGCAAADLASTHYALGRGAVEGNPVMRRNPWLVKGLVTGSWLGAQWVFQRRTPRRAWMVGNWVMGSAWCGAAGWNVTR